MKFPKGGEFAFTIVDDTDNANVQNVKPVYDFLTELGFRITKTVWVYPPRDSFKGECLQDEHYAQWIRQLQKQGHEIALHNVGSGAFSRKEILDGLEIFKATLGSYPRMQVNHVSNPDNLYWRPNVRFRHPVRALYRLVQWILKLARERPYVLSSGEDPHSQHFWGDFCSREISYVRNLTFPELNTLKSDSRMPYHDDQKPFVRNWFSSSDGHTVDHFIRLMASENVERLKRERGVAIIYTHFTDGFVQHGQLNEEFVRIMKNLARENAWFAPASQILDLLSETRSERAAESSYLRFLESKWLIMRLKSFMQFGR